MAYREDLAIRIRERLAEIPSVEEKKMMGGLTFMVNDKMCVGIFKNDLMCRIDPQLHETLVEKPGCRTMDFSNRPMIGYVVVDDSGMSTQKDFDYWIDLALDFNKRAKSSRRKAPKKASRTSRQDEVFISLKINSRDKTTPPICLQISIPNCPCVTRLPRENTT